MSRTREHVKVVTGLKGVDLLSDPTQIEPQRFRRLENFYPPRTAAHLLAKRLGSVKYNAAAIAGATRVDNMVRAWKSDGTKKLIVAVNHAGNDELHYGDDTAGTFTKITGGTAPSSGRRWFFVNWPLLGKVYAFCGDGVTPIAISSDFTTKADMVVGGAGGLTDARFGQFGAVFYQRLITARTATKPSYYYMFDAAVDDTITNASQFGRIAEPITAIGVNAFATSGASLLEMLMLFGSHTMWYVPGDPTTVPPQRASGSIGCLSPKTFCNTPAGAMFLASDRMVYLINADPKYPQKVGIRIFPETNAIPVGQLPHATAAYHNHFYKLRFAPPGGVTDTVEYWADLLPLVLGLPDAEVEWYGPMTNLALSSLVVEDGPDDAAPTGSPAALPILGGSSSDGTVWTLDQPTLYVDGGATIVGRLWSPEHTEGDPLREKIWAGFTFGYLKTANGRLQLDVLTNAGAAQFSKEFSWEVAAAEWDAAHWDVDSWFGAAFQEDVLNFDVRIVGRTMQERITHAMATDYQIRDYGRKYRVIPRMI